MVETQMNWILEVLKAHCFVSGPQSRPVTDTNLPKQDALSRHP